MGSIQFPEIVIILLLALLLFGPKKLPEIGRTLGSAIRELRKAAQEFSSSVEQLDVSDDIAIDDSEKE
jgi:TatA/E family protein of Tat protein translocase